MTDRFSAQLRSYVMSRVRSKNTSPEKRVRRFLFATGTRFRLHSKALPGTPDIVLRKWRIVVFVNGCFWHHHPRCKRAGLPESNYEFWVTKINRNVVRDRKHYRELRRLGWKVIVVWECQTKDEQTLAKVFQKLHI